MNSLQNKRIDYYKIYTKKPGLSTDTRAAMFAVLPFAAVAVVAAVLIAGKYVSLRGLQSQIEEERAYLAEPSVAADYEEYLNLHVVHSALSDVDGDLLATMDALHTYPEISSALFERVFASADETISITSFSYDETTTALLINGSSRDVYDASGFARALESVSNFSDVTYTGYQSGTDSSYYFTLQCRLAGSAAEEAQN